MVVRWMLSLWQDSALMCLSAQGQRTPLSPPFSSWAEDVSGSILASWGQQAGAGPCCLGVTVLLTRWQRGL